MNIKTIFLSCLLLSALQTTYAKFDSNKFGKKILDFYFIINIEILGRFLLILFCFIKREKWILSEKF